jgi:hypothetical protein
VNASLTRLCAALQLLTWADAPSRACGCTADCSCGCMDWDELEAAVLAGGAGGADALAGAAVAVAPAPQPQTVALRAPPPLSAAALLQLRCLSAAHEPGCMRCAFPARCVSRNPGSCRDSLPCSAAACRRPLPARKKIARCVSYTARCFARLLLEADALLLPHSAGWRGRSQERREAAPQRADVHARVEQPRRARHRRRRVRGGAASSG